MAAEKLIRFYKKLGIKIELEPSLEAGTAFTYWDKQEKRFVIKYNPSTNDDMPLTKILGHEFLHIYNGDPLVDLGSPFLNYIRNIAEDFKINKITNFPKGIGYVDEIFLEKAIGCKCGINYKEGTNAIFLHLQNHLKNQGGDSEKGKIRIKCYEAVPQDQINEAQQEIERIKEKIYELSKEKDENDIKELADILKEYLKEKEKAHDKKAGRGRSEFRKAEGIKPVPNKLLNQLISMLNADDEGEGEDYKRMHRRERVWGVGREILYPCANALFIIDVSGSMWENIKMINEAIMYIALSYKVDKLFFNTNVKFVPGSVINEWFESEGGTEIKPVIDWLKYQSKKYNLIVLISDLAFMDMEWTEAVKKIKAYCTKLIVINEKLNLVKKY
jgi:hypothetical protein